jgi:hypothetical protein
MPALAWRLKPAKASHEKPGQARLFVQLSKACGSGFDFRKLWAMAQAVAFSQICGIVVFYLVGVFWLI